MEYDVVILWIVVLSSLSGLVRGLRQRHLAGRGWVVVYLAILLVAGAGGWWTEPMLVYTAAIMWLVLVLLPGLIGRQYHRLFLQQQYAAAGRLARIISWLHPVDGWRAMPGILRALDLAKRGDVAAATDALKPFHNVRSIIGVAAVFNLYRITDQWEALLVWCEQYRREVNQYASLLPVLLRAHGEVGDLRGLVELYDRNRHQIAKLNPATTRDQCRLILFAFCGKQEAVRSLCAGSLAIIPAATREFWMATADLAAGAAESAKSRLEQLLPAADPTMRLAIQRRLARLATPPAQLDATAERVLEAAAVERGHEERFGAQRSLFSSRARTTQILILLNVLMFVVEVSQGGATNPETLYRLGAMVPMQVRAGEWWRLLAALFLHLGWLHLAMNMLALWVLGPFTEFALGFRRFLTVYLAAGIGSMAAVMVFASQPDGGPMTVGASGCIMGLVGATGALMLRGWLADKALTARRRLVAVVLIILMQSTFDFLVPQVSMTAHLSGVVIGFLATLLLRDRLRHPPLPAANGKS